MSTDFTYRISTTRFDEDYSPSQSSRATTNFANLARGDDRRENLRSALAMIDRRFNDLAAVGQPGGRPLHPRARHRLGRRGVRGIRR